jgi:RNA polymerase sigma factor (sigma-70 family)
MYFEAVRISAQKYVTEQYSRDIALGTFSKLWEHRKKFNKWEHLLGFIFATTRNSSLTWIRNENNENKKRKEYAFHRQSDQQENNDYILDRLLYLLLDDPGLTGKRKETVQLLFDGYNIDEVADKLNITRETAQNYKSQALSLMRQKFHEIKDT